MEYRTYLTFLLTFLWTLNWFDSVVDGIIHIGLNSRKVGCVFLMATVRTRPYALLCRISYAELNQNEYREYALHFIGK